MVDAPSQYTSKIFQSKKGTEIIKGTRNKQTGICEATIETQQSEIVGNNILSQTTKLELAHYFHAALFSPTTASLLKAIKKGFLKTWTGLTEKIIKKHIEKSIIMKMGHLHMRGQGLKSTIEKPPDTDLEDKSKTNVVF